MIVLFLNFVFLAKRVLLQFIDRVYYDLKLLKM